MIIWKVYKSKRPEDYLAPYITSCDAWLCESLSDFDPVIICDQDLPKAVEIKDKLNNDHANRFLNGQPNC